MLARDVQIGIISSSIIAQLSVQYTDMCTIINRKVLGAPVSKIYPAADTEAFLSNHAHNRSQYYHKHEWKGECRRFQEAPKYRSELQKQYFLNTLAPS